MLERTTRSWSFWLLMVPAAFCPTNLYAAALACIPVVCALALVLKLSRQLARIRRCNRVR